ncbi:tRNA glutamyl-Q(34) synthetase GluQRS [Micrococcales bacterium 31B]|nr:tRNA glutamyl-Q(34) synthetase GluQRS [Micrococcales bacterium 31B]
MTSARGRFAPSPTGDFHLGNLRTALYAYVFARHAGGDFIVRVEDLDRSRVRPGVAERQLADLAALGLTWQGPVVYQSQRESLYEDALATLRSQGRVYECYCSRREIREAVAESLGAPHHAVGFYAGTCRELSTAEREARRAERPAALRLRADAAEVGVADLVHGEYLARVDDFILRRGDGGFAYNLAVVVDDAAQGVTQVVRGDDLLESAPRQTFLARALGLKAPSYAHVPLVLNPAGQRLAKRDGAVTRADLARQGVDDAALFLLIAHSMGLLLDSGRDRPTAPTRVLLDALVAEFQPAHISREPWVFRAAAL